MKKAVAVGVACSFALMAGVPRAHAESFFQIEAGLGYSKGVDIGDGVWWQQGAPRQSIDLNAPALLLGVTGNLYSQRQWTVDYHIDYVYLANMTASCECVPDINYNPHAHQVVGIPAYKSPFNGFAHVQGISATISPGYSFGNGWKVAADLGGWVFWQTSHESQIWQGVEPQNMSHKTVPQFSYVVGARVEKGPYAISYRYYNMPQKWNPYPGLIRGAHVIAVTYKF